MISKTEIASEILTGLIGLPPRTQPLKSTY